MVTERAFIIFQAIEWKVGARGNYHYELGRCERLDKVSHVKRVSLSFLSRFVLISFVSFNNKYWKLRLKSLSLYPIINLMVSLLPKGPFLHHYTTSYSKILSFWHCGSLPSLQRKWLLIPWRYGRKPIESLMTFTIRHREAPRDRG